jgi:hypothetical protein
MALRPSDSAANVAIFSNTGEPLMQCALQYSRAPLHWFLKGVFGMFGSYLPAVAT